VLSRKRQRVIGAWVLALMVASLVLLAVHSSLLNETLLSSDKCPVCHWQKSLSLGQVSLPVVQGAWFVGQPLCEPVDEVCPRHFCRPFSARSPPAHPPS